LKYLNVHRPFTIRELLKNVMHSLLLEAVIVDTHPLGKILKYLSFEYNGENGLLKLRKILLYLFSGDGKYTCICVCVCVSMCGCVCGGL
jgi:membrane-associated PAP2 superfamily phosphatase